MRSSKILGYWFLAFSVKIVTFYFLQRGDVIGLLMENKAKYMAYIIGLAKIGVTVALINFHLKEEVRKNNNIGN